jgi:hypothetical protein
MRAEVRQKSVHGFIPSIVATIKRLDFNYKAWYKIKFWYSWKSMHIYKDIVCQLPNKRLKFQISRGGWLHLKGDHMKLS